MKQDNIKSGPGSRSVGLRSDERESLDPRESRSREATSASQSGEEDMSMEGRRSGESDESGPNQGGRSPPSDQPSRERDMGQGPAPPPALPTCQPDGSFAAKQCVDSMCWCVDLKGEPVKDSGRYFEEAERLKCGRTLHTFQTRTFCVHLNKLATGLDLCVSYICPNEIA